LKDLESTAPVPLNKLVGFRRVSLKPGQSRRLEFFLQPEQMMLVGEDGKSVLEPGRFRLTVGGCSPSARGEALGAPAPVSIEFEVR
jgi:beta-glucosidase